MQAAIDTHRQLPHRTSKNTSRSSALGPEIMMAVASFSPSFFAVWGSSRANIPLNRSHCCCNVERYTRNRVYSAWKINLRQVSTIHDKKLAPYPEHNVTVRVIMTSRAMKVLHISTDRGASMNVRTLSTHSYNFCEAACHAHDDTKGVKVPLFREECGGCDSEVIIE